MKTIEVIEGTGPVARAGDWLTIHYVGSLLPSGRVFDDTRARQKPFVFQLGAGDVIEGWERGLLGLKVGGKRRLEIPAALAYGARGAEPLVPPGADLCFEVELLSIRQ